MASRQKFEACPHLNEGGECDVGTRGVVLADHRGVQIRDGYRIVARGVAHKISRSVFLAWILLAASVSSVSGQPVRVHLWVKAFIPKTHQTNPGYVKAVPGSPGKWMIPGPT